VEGPVTRGGAPRGAVLHRAALERLRDSLRAALGGLPRVFWTLLAGAFVNRLASFVGPFLALYLVRERGFAANEAGRIVALFGVGQIVAGPLGGTLADAWGRRRTMLLSFVLGALTVGSIGFARAPALLATLTFLSSLTSELYRPAMQAAVADVVEPRERARAWGLVYWAVNLGWTFGLALGGFLASRSFTALFLADAATTLAFAVIVARGVPETRPPGLHAHSPLAGLARVFADGPFVGFLLLNLTAIVVFVQFQLAVPIDMNAHGLGPGTFALLLSLNALGVVVLQPFVGPALARRDAARVLAASALLIGTGYGVNVLAGWLPPLPVYVACVVLFTIGEVTGFPTSAALVANLAPPELRGRYQGAYTMSWGVAFAIAPLLGGELLTRLGGRSLWVACLALSAAVAAGHLLTAGARRRRLAGATAPRGELAPPAI
jgi:MFS family permease